MIIDFSKIEIKYNTELDKELDNLYREMIMGQFTNQYCTERLVDILKTREKNNYFNKTGNYLSMMKIYYDGKLVGLSLPKKLTYEDKVNYGIENKGDYFRLGVIFITNAFRSNGIGKYVLNNFINRYTNVVYIPNIINIPSNVVALKCKLNKSKEINIGKSIYVLYVT